jgi:pyruvate dehydrogenase E2 component (dihydrolipoamide acetyltransferase)
MAVDILMPNLGFDTQTGRLIEWLKQPGDSVTKGEAIAIIESDKANVELEAIAGGVLLEQRVQPDQEVPVGAVIARIGAAGEASAPAPRISPVAQRIARDLQVDAGQIAGSGTRGRVTRRDVEALRQVETSTPTANGTDAGADARGIKALPAVRRAARQRGIDLADMRAAGFPNPITLAMLEAYAGQQAAPAAAAPAPQPPTAQTPTAAPAGATAVPLSRMRQTIGRRLSESMREAPHFYVTGEFDFEAALTRLEKGQVRAKINDLLLYLTVQTLLRVPSLNRTLEGGTLYAHDRVNLAIAVAREDGLITPVLHDAGRYSITGLADESRTLIDRARSNHLSADDLQGGTFTISNLGMVQQVDHFTAVLNPPQVGILAVGALKPRPVVVNGGLFIRRTAHLTLSGDHRAVDGMDLARFMATFQEELDRFSA